MFSSDDFRIDSVSEFIMFLPILIFVGLIAPFVIGAYHLGFVMDKLGWLD